MGRWTQYDEDDYRLPEGMKRVGYDSDSGRYYFRDGAGVVYEGGQGAEFGEMTRVSGAPVAIPEESSDDDLEAAPSRADGYKPLATESGTTSRRLYTDGASYRTMFPFFLLVAVVLLLIWRLVVHPTSSPPPPPPCPDKTTPYWVKSGDSCWEISRVHGCSLERFKELNRKVDCDRLMPGRRVCLPAGKIA
ncbi:carbohydrate-binding module family 50 protein [Piloderma croceum F 1598]|uniref:Carbohydrate-binding module family 50 protein n=1 Tax=Piloderma croceum (strain F 1598) TaxID=765440 RepID=A0A0C3FCG9_PILCF|nr:carbohydrate-binding module family 50 protein [Piloderma croceum F 1598]